MSDFLRSYSSHAIDLFAYIGQSNIGTVEKDWTSAAPPPLPGRDDRSAIAADITYSGIFWKYGKPNQADRTNLLGQGTGSGTFGSTEPRNGGMHHRFALDWHKATGRKVGFFQYAKGGSSITNDAKPSSWFPSDGIYDGTAADLLDGCLQDLRAAMNYLSTHGLLYTFRGFIWNQGTADANSNQRDSYKSRLRLLKNILSAEFLSDFVPCGDYHKFFSIIRSGGTHSVAEDIYEVFKEPMSKWEAIRSAQVELAAEEPDCQIVSYAAKFAFVRHKYRSSDLSEVHWNQQLQNEIGEDVVRAILTGSPGPKPLPRIDLVVSRFGGSVKVDWHNPDELAVFNVLQYRLQGTDLWETCDRRLTADSAAYASNLLYVGNTVEYRIISQGVHGDAVSKAVAYVAPQLQPLSDYRAVTGIVENSAQDLAIQSILATISAQGAYASLQSLFLLTIGFNADLGLTAYDVVGNAQLSLPNAGLVRTVTGYRLSGKAGEAMSVGAKAPNPLPASGNYTWIVLFSRESFFGKAGIFSNMIDSATVSRRTLTLKKEPNFSLNQKYLFTKASVSLSKSGITSVGFQYNHNTGIKNVFYGSTDAPVANAGGVLCANIPVRVERGLAIGERQGHRDGAPIKVAAFATFNQALSGAAYCAIAQSLRTNLGV